jgi:hypothetical protein
MPRFQFERETRTPDSECYVIVENGTEYGRVDVHYTGDMVNATVCLPEDVSEDDIQEVIGEIDERIVMSAEPFRDDLVVTVWLGRLGGVYSEEFDEEFDEDLLEEEIEGDGHHRN